MSVPAVLSDEVPGPHKRFTWERAVRDLSELTPGQKLVALTLATYMNDKTGACWPSLDTLEKVTGRSRGSLCGKKGDLAALERSGWLQRDRGGGRGHLTVYRARVPLVVLSALNSSESEPFSPGEDALNSSESEPFEPETVRLATETARSPRPNNQEQSKAAAATKEEILENAPDAWRRAEQRTKDEGPKVRDRDAYTLRIARDDYAEQLAEQERQRERERDTAEIAACPVCESTGMRWVEQEGRDVMVRCNHDLALVWEGPF
jgi:hypothetical protein